MERKRKRKNYIKGFILFYHNKSRRDNYLYIQI